MEGAARISAGLPLDRRLFAKHTVNEPALYSTVVQDWGTSLMISLEPGERASCLVELGHHAPTLNVEMTVSRLARAGKLSGFHFDDRSTAAVTSTAAVSTRAGPFS